MTDAHCHISCGDANVRELLIGRDFFGVHPWESLGGLGGLDVWKFGSLDGNNSTVNLNLQPQPVGLGGLGGLGSRVEGLGFRVEGLGSREEGSIDSALSSILYHLSSNPKAGVGEIGLDRLKAREIPPLMRELFEAQLKLAIELKRPVVLHGAKCWGQVVAAVRQLTTRTVPEVKVRGEGEQRNLKHPFSNSNSQLATHFLFHGFSRSDGLIPDIVALNGFISVGPAVLNDHAVNYRELVKKIPIERLLVETDRTEANAAECPPIAEVLAKTAELRGMSAAELEAITDRNADVFLAV